MQRILIISSLVCLAIFLALPASLYADFAWVDQNGNTRHTKYPPQPHQVKKYLSGAQSQPQSSDRVDLYVTSWCPYCHKAKKFFEDRKVRVNVYDIEKDKKAAARKRKFDRQSGVPFAVVNGKGIHGYAPDQYLQALKAK